MQQTLTNYKRNKRDPLRGAALVEAVIILPVFLLLAFGLISISLNWSRVFLFEDALRATAREVSLFEEEELWMCRNTASDHLVERLKGFGIEIDRNQISLNSLVQTGISTPDLSLVATIPPCIYCFFISSQPITRSVPVYLEDPNLCV